MTERAKCKIPAESRGGDATSLRWFVAKTHPNGEQKALFHLERQGFNVYLPRYLRRVSHARRVSWQPRPLFPTYLFVSMRGPDQRWRAINSTVGVAHLISDERGPIPVPPGTVEALRVREDSRGFVSGRKNKSFEKGTPVQVTQGAFADQVGLFDSITDDERVIILLDIMGRQVKSRLKLDAITDFI